MQRHMSVSVTQKGILEPSDSFDFEQLSLSNPISLTGGTYFTKISNATAPLYIQTPACITKQGIHKSGKHYVCELMFDNTASSFIHWLEKLETTCQQLIYSKSADWFQNPLELTDIEGAFTSPIKTYKSGKYYLVGTSIKTRENDELAVRIYNENEQIKTMYDITGFAVANEPFSKKTEQTQIISILDVQGIKFTSRNFRIELEMKQCMIMDNDGAFFENCLIKSSRSIVSKIGMDKIHVEPDVDWTTLGEDADEPPPLPQKEKEIVSDNAVVAADDTDDFELVFDTPSAPAAEEEEEEVSTEPDELEAEMFDDDTIENTKINATTGGVDAAFEMNATSVTTPATITLKSHSDVYRGIYEKAKEAAKNAKMQAIKTKEELKHIRAQYNIDSESDDEFAEI